MKTLSRNRTGQDPCLQIQADLSAMLDGELDTGSVRRVMVHSDVCPSCRAFLEGIRDQARAHRDLADAGVLVGGEVVEDGVPQGEAADRLRRHLMENRRQLARILYELGRGFALMGLDPDFSKIVAREPVPIPDMAQKGRNLVDEVRREHGDVGFEWVRAKELIEGSGFDTPRYNLEKGERLLRECLLLTPSCHEARIYLGMVHHVQRRHEESIADFSDILEGAEDPVMRAFALLNMGNVYLETHRVEEAIRLFEALVESGVIADQPRFAMVYFNLALSHALLRRFEESRVWFERLYHELPHKRSMVARELRSRENLREVLASEPEAAARFRNQFPMWFPLEDVCSQGEEAC